MLEYQDMGLNQYYQKMRDGPDMVVASVAGIDNILPKASDQSRQLNNQRDDAQGSTLGSTVNIAFDSKGEHNLREDSMEHNEEYRKRRAEQDAVFGGLTEDDDMMASMDARGRPPKMNTAYKGETEGAEGITSVNYKPIDETTAATSADSEVSEFSRNELIYSSLFLSVIIPKCP